MVTIRDVASRAGVSVATVSRVLSGAGKVRLETAARVRETVQELGFRPNAIGRHLSTAHTRSLGVVLPSLSNPVFAEAVAGINDVVRSQGYTLMLTSIEYDRAEEMRAVSALLEYRVEGLILTVTDPDGSPVLDLLDAAGVPYVLIYNQPSARQRPTVTVDNIAAGRAAAEALMHLGHARLGMVSGRFTASDRARARYDGFLAAIAARHYPAPRIVEVDFVDLDVEAVLTDIYADRDTAPTALFCSNDLLAISVIGALGRMGLRVPQDVSVIGFDGIAVGTHLHPTLATVAQPSREMGRVATQQLLGRLAGQAAPPTVILPTILRLGESAGPAAKPSPAALQDTHPSPRKGHAS